MNQVMTFDVYAKHMFVGSLTVFIGVPMGFGTYGHNHMFVDTSGNMLTSDMTNGTVHRVSRYKQLNLRRRS